MKCSNCGATLKESVTTSVTDCGDYLIIIRNVPCFKCIECNEILYTADVVQKLEKLISSAKNLSQEIAVVDFQKSAA